MKVVHRLSDTGESKVSFKSSFIPVLVISLPTQALIVRDYNFVCVDCVTKILKRFQYRPDNPPKQARVCALMFCYWRNSQSNKQLALLVAT